MTARGWAVDPDSGAPIIVPMYVDGASNAMTWANESRADIAAAFPATSANHGYTLSMAVSPSWQTACVYALNAGPGSNRALGWRAINVPQNTTPTGHLDSSTTPR